MDLETRLKTSENYLKCNPDRRLGGLPYFESCLTGKVPYLSHNMWDLCDVGWRFVEAWHMIRRVTARPINNEEKCLRELVFKTLRPDGLCYRNEETWSSPEAWMWDQSRALLAFCSLAEGNDGVELALSSAKNMLQALNRIALRDGDSLWFPVEGWDGKQWKSLPVGHPPTGLQIEGAVRYYNLTKESWALEFADRVASGVMSRVPPMLSPEGLFHPNGGGPDIPNTHLHSRLFILGGLIHLSNITGNSRYFKMAEDGFHAALDISTSYGWVPERLEQLEQGANGVDEVCCIMDMIKLALLMINTERADLYDMVERYVANGVIAHQLLDYSRIEPFLSNVTLPDDTRQFSYHEVLKRCLGGFTGALHAHEFWRGTEAFPFVEASGCCSPAGIVCLSLAWQHALEETSDNVVIMHMHFLRHGRLVDIEKATPEEGNVVIKIKGKVSKLGVRLPPWAVREKINISFDDCPVEFHIKKDYLWVDAPSGTVRIKYPSVARKTNEPWQGNKLEAHWDGNIVKSIESDPPPRIPVYPVIPLS